MRLFLILSFLSKSFCLIQNDWSKLESQVTLRYFSPGDFSPSENAEEIWQIMGKNIDCHIQDNKAEITMPGDFNGNLPIKILTHGFSDTTNNDKARFVDAWMTKYNREVNVILVDWHQLASPNAYQDLSNYVYDYAARNCIDVGEYLGLCLAELSNSFEVPAENFHLVGHSLGAHVMGKAGRSFTQSKQQKVGRITGLDPAGPRFVDGPILSAIPELFDNKLTKESANFVDIIHTNGDLAPCVVCTKFRSGALLQIGHMDFYPDGGSSQSGCAFGQDAKLGGACSHGRSVLYFYHSIREPSLFPALPCDSVSKCNNQQASGNQATSYMGERSAESWDGQSRKLFYLKINNCHWNYNEHNNAWCVRRR